MIGRVERRHGMVPIALKTSGRLIDVEFVVDTGFTGELTLPATAVASLQPPLLYEDTISLADDSEASTNIHAAVIDWVGAERTVRVIATGSRPLVGAALLQDCELLVQSATGGLVTVEPL